ncbi:MAG: hypothetical protein AB1489_36750 [Acidobacteriota bacterium]
MILLLLWALASIDAAFIGYREAAGRSALINKRTYYRRAMFRGALFGQMAVGIAAATIVILLLLSPQPAILVNGFKQAGTRMLIIYLPYATIILLTFIIRLVPSVDLQSITSILIFGPFTFIRPIIVLIGVVWGVLAAPNLATLLLGMIILTLMLTLEWIIARLRTYKMIS